MTFDKDNPGHILPPNPDDTGWEPHEAPTVAEQVATSIQQHQDGSISVNRSQDVEPVLEYAKEMARTDQAWSPSRELMLAATFPFSLCEQYMADKGITMEEFMHNPAHIKAMLSDPDLADFRVAANSVHKKYH